MQCFGASFLKVKVKEVTGAEARFAEGEQPL